jgi:hypothetical protein
MNCERMQRRLLASEAADRPPGDVAAHLAECSTCQDWQRRLLQVEAEVSQLPLPATQAPPALLKHFLHMPAKTKPTAETHPVAVTNTLKIGAYRATVKDRGRWKMSVAFATAAALVLLAFGAFVWQRDHRGPAVEIPKPQRDALLASLTQHDLRLAAAQNPAERVLILSDIAYELHGKARVLVHTGAVNDLEKLAELYQKVVCDGIIKQADQVPVAEREKVLVQIANGLNAARSEAAELAQLNPSTGGKALTRIASAADAGERHLRKLMGVTS